MIAAKVKAAAALLRLDELLQRKPTQLSGGQRQRVAIGRAIVREPKLFLFDEPLSNLDAELRVSMRAEIRDLHSRLKATMIYVTHDQVEAMTMADKIVVLRAGRIEQVGSPLALYNTPANTFVAGFIGSPRMNLVPAAAAVAGGARLPMPDAHTIGIRPEHASVAADGPLRVRITQVEQLGGSSLLHGRIADDLPFEIVLAGADRGPARGHRRRRAARRAPAQLRPRRSASLTGGRDARPRPRQPARLRSARRAFRARRRRIAAARPRARAGARHLASRRRLPRAAHLGDRPDRRRALGRPGARRRAAGSPARRSRSSATTTASA